jgi:protein SCO1
MRPGGHSSKEQRRGARRRFLFVAPGAIFALLLLSRALLLLYGGPTHRTPPAIGGPFRLVADTGEIVTERNFRGKYLLIYFGYTACPDVCPTTLNEIAHALALLGPRAARLQALFITVDPRHDTPLLVAKYVTRFSPELIGLTGSPAEIAAVEKEYRVSVDVVPDRGHAGGYTIDHTAVLYVMGPDGQFITALRADQSGADMAAAIAKLMS